MTILEWVKKNSIEGANIAEVEELIEKNTFDGIKTKEQAMDFISKNQVFKSANDSLISTAVNSHDDKFKENKLPDLIKAEREKILKELKPEMTPEQKELQELKQWRTDSEKREKSGELKSALRAKATELKYDPVRAEKFASFGDDALKMLEDDSIYWNGQIDTRIKESIKGTLAGTPPKGGTPPDGKMSLEDIGKLPTREARKTAMAEAGY